MLFITYDSKVSIEQPSRRLVFNDTSVTCDSYGDSSPAAQNDDGAESQSRNVRLLPQVAILHRIAKSGEVRRLACP